VNYKENSGIRGKEKALMTLPEKKYAIKIGLYWKSGMRSSI